MPNTYSRKKLLFIDSNGVEQNLGNVIPLCISIIKSTNPRLCKVHSFAFFALCYVKLPEYSTFIRIIIKNAPEDNTITEGLQ